MTLREDAAATDNAIAAEQIKAYVEETRTGNIVGALILSLIAWGNAEYVPFWTWGPALAIVYCVTVIRAYLFRAFRRNPMARPPAAWGFGQTVCATVTGLCWGFANTTMCAYLPVEHQLFVAAVAAVAVSFAAAGGFAYFNPPKGFIITSMVPLIVWFYGGGDRIHLVLAVMMTIYLASVLKQGAKRHNAFVEALRLRFRNELLAQELARQKDLAEEAGRAKSRFLAAASHDLRQPVQALTFFQELIRPEMTLSAKGEHHFAKMQQAVAAVSSLLDSMLDISRLDAGAIEVRPERFPVVEVLDQLQAEFGPQARQLGIDLRFAECSAELETDPMLLAQLLRNFVTNALRYTPNGAVLVGCRRRGGGVAIEVWDTGIGIHPDHQRAIFGEFFQVGNPERDRRQGLGLGLAIVDRIARLIGATVAVRSVPGKGSCFSVLLPPQPGPPILLGSGAPRDGGVSLPADLEGRLVVVVENEEEIRSGICALLEGWGCEVLARASGADVAERIDSLDRSIDAIVSDYGLAGGENGIDVIHTLRRLLGYECPALLITGDTSPVVLQAAHGADLQVLHKPVRPAQLRQVLASLIGN